MHQYPFRLKLQALAKAVRGLVRGADATPQRPCVVIDTNSLVAARWKKGGASARIMQLCIDGRVRALVSPAVEEENRHILAKVRPPQAFMEHLERFFASAEVVRDTPDLAVSEDPADNKFVECAVAGNADYIISSDHHLLDLDGYEGIRICHSGTFLREAME